MIQSAIRLLALVAAGLLIAVAIAAIWGAPFWVVIVFLVALVAIDSIGRDKQPPDHLDQTGGFPRSRRR